MRQLVSGRVVRKPGEPTMSDGDRLESEARGTTDRATDPDDLSESLDDDNLPADYPPDEPMGSLDYGTTRAEARIPEPLDERVKREKPADAMIGEVDRAGRLVEPDQGGGPDLEKAAVADDIDQVAPHDKPVGDVGTGDVTVAETASELTQDLSAEEAAVHVEEEPDVDAPDKH